MTPDTSDGRAASGGPSFCPERASERSGAASGGPAEAAPRLERRGLLLGLGAVPLAFLTRGEDPPPASDPAPGAVTVLLLRHAEAEEGSARDPGLSSAGEQRANALADLLAPADVREVWTSAYRRARETAAPLAERIGREARTYDPRVLDDIASRLARLAAGTVAVVVGHSNTTPALLALLGGPQPGGLEDSPHGPVIAEERHDRLFLVQLVREGEASAARHLATLELSYGT